MELHQDHTAPLLLVILVVLRWVHMVLMGRHQARMVIRLRDLTVLRLGCTLRHLGITRLRGLLVCHQDPTVPRLALMAIHLQGRMACHRVLMGCLQAHLGIPCPDLMACRLLATRGTATEDEAATLLAILNDS